MSNRDYLLRSQLLLEYLLAIDSDGRDTEDPLGPNPETAEHDHRET